MLARARTKLHAVPAAAVLVALMPAFASASTVTISPLPGTPDAMPQTQISILGTPASNIASVSVTGTESGAHGGQLEPYSDNEGASFVLESPLMEGEEVEVMVDLQEGGLLRDDFSVAHLAPPEGLAYETGEKPGEQEDFFSEREFHPPKVKVNKADPSLEGDFFLDPEPAPRIHLGAEHLIEFEVVGPPGLMILNPEGKLLWWDQMTNGDIATNFEPITYEGKSALAWWQGLFTEAGSGEGEGIIANTSYEPIAWIRAGNGLSADLHELTITSAGQAFIDAYELECDPTCSAGNPRTVDAVVQEIDIHTGLVMWEWHAMPEIPLAESLAPPINGIWDPYHINSIQPLPGHRLLVSLRNTSAVYEIERDSGAVIWRLGGRSSSFTLGKNAQVWFQHDARLGGKKLNELTVFDDEGGPPNLGIARGLILKLNTSRMTASVEREYPRPQGTVTQAEGSVQLLPRGDAMVGYGASQYFTEFTNSSGGGKKGKVLFDAELPEGDGSYRVFRLPWSAAPNTLPAVAAVRESLDDVSVYASWNGATSVASWEVLAGESSASLTPAASAPWSGFETKIAVPGTDSKFEVRALNSEGRVLATSEAVSAS